MDLLRILAAPAGYFGLVAALFFLAALVELALPGFKIQHPRARRWPANIGFFLVNLLLGAVMGQMLATLFLSWGIPYGSAWLALKDWSPLVILTVSILALDLWQYLFHRLMHYFNLGWRIHRVHHSDRDFDFTTGFRFHPLEAVLNVLWRTALVLALGIIPVSLLVYGLLVLTIDYFTHANVRLPPAVDRVLRLLIVTPAMHRIHHAQDFTDSNRNFGTIFTLWDRLFGTYRQHATLIRKGQPVGVAEIPARASLNFGRALWIPFAR